MNELETKYFKKLNESIRTGTPVDFPINNSIVQADREFLIFVANTDKLKVEYLDGKNLHPEDVDFLIFILNHLKKYKEKRDLKSFEIIKGFYLYLDHPNLSTKLKVKFDRGIFILEKTIDYFCSYTSKGLPQINFTYKELIKAAYGINYDSDIALLKSTNFIAKLIVQYFKDHGFNNYFFDLDKIVNGDEINEKVLDYCCRTTVLIILAQRETFRDIVNQTNWCYKEYEHYSKTHPDEKQLLVYKIPDVARPADASPEIQSWFDYLGSGQSNVRGETIKLDWTTHQLMIQIDKDAQTIKDAKERLFSNFIYNLTLEL